MNNTRPETTITSGPSGTGNSTSATFEFTSSELESAFRCKLDGAAVESCSSPKSYPTLAPGQHVFEVYAVGSGGEANDSDGTPASRTWSVGQTQRPANDDFANAQALTGASATVNGPNVGATKETGEPNHVNNQGGKSVWYEWTPQSSGTATIDTRGSSFDTLLALYTGSAVNGLTGVASNDDEDNPNGVRTSRVVDMPVTAGTAYHIAIDGWNEQGAGAESGTITLHLSSRATDTTAPNVSLTAPEADSVVGGATVTLYANATDNVGVDKVEFRIDGSVVATDNSAPYNASWDSRTVADGEASVSARAFDAASSLMEERGLAALHPRPTRG